MYLANCNRCGSEVEIDILNNRNGFKIICRRCKSVILDAHAENPQGFHAVAAPTLEELFEFANEITQK